MKKIYIYAYYQYRCALELYAFYTKEDAVNYALSRLSSLLASREADYFNKQDIPEDMIQLRKSINDNDLAKTIELWEVFSQTAFGGAPYINRIEEKEIFSDNIKLNHLRGDVAGNDMWAVNVQPAININLIQPALRGRVRANPPVFDFEPLPPIQEEIFEEDGDAGI